MAGGTDGNWVLTKSKRTDTRANLTISNRDTEAFEFALEFDKESCRWNKLTRDESVVNEKERFLHAIVDFIKSEEAHHWEGTATELLTILQAREPILVSYSAAVFSKSLKAAQDSLREIYGVSYRHITTNNIEATSPEALKGLSIRTQENPIHMASFQAWGASPTPMAFSELFTALQQGAVDAEENPLAVITANRLYEVQNTVTLTGHFYTAGIFNINKDFYESLEGQDKEWFDEASEHFVQNLTQLIRDAQEGYIQLLKDNGINVVEVTSEQKDAFIESAASVYDLFIEKYGGTQELIDLAMKYNDDF